MDQNVIYNIATNYAREYGLMDRLDDLKELIKNHGNMPFYIFRYMSVVKNFMIVSKHLKFTIEVPSRREYHFLEDLKKKMFYSSKKRKSSKRTN